VFGDIRRQGDHFREASKRKRPHQFDQGQAATRLLQPSWPVGSKLRVVSVFQKLLEQIFPTSPNAGEEAFLPDKI